MSVPRKDQMAFPIMSPHGQPWSEGLTIREYFAIHILAGIKASTPGCAFESCADLAITQADELINKLNEAIK